MIASTFGSTHDFFTSGTWLVIRNLDAVLRCRSSGSRARTGYYKDARRRIEDPWLVGMATLLGLVPPYVGPLIYMLFRPPEYLEDVRERELRSRRWRTALEARPHTGASCGGRLEFLVCPICTTKLKAGVHNCKSPLEALWQVCPFCETPIEPAAAAAVPRCGRGAVFAPREAGSTRLARRGGTERTLILIKPDAVKRRLAGEISAGSRRAGSTCAPASC